jgi:CheY-like chemotaxis protein
MTNLEFSEQAIVVIDDDPDTRTIYQVMLRRVAPQAALYFADDGTTGVPQVVEAVANHKKVVVLSDMEMAKMSGPEVLRTLRTSDNEAVANVPVIINTAHAGGLQEIRAKIMEQSGGHDQFDLLKKPLLSATLQQAILKALSE